MNRLPLIPIEDNSNPALAQIFDAARSARGAVSDLYRTLGHAPAMLEAWTAMAWPLRSEPRTPRAVRELIIMRAAQLTGAVYEWGHHWPMALAAGVPREKLLTLSTWNQDESFTPEERAVLAYAERVLADGRVDNDVFARLAGFFDPEEIVEITLTTTFYACVARLLLALRIELEPEYAEQMEGWA